MNVSKFHPQILANLKGLTITIPISLSNLRFSPVAILKSQLEIETFEFRPGHPEIIIAGCSNGQLALFSLKKLRSFHSQKTSNAKGTKDNNEIVEIENFLTSSILESFNATQNVTNTESFSRKMVYLNSHRAPVKSIRFLPPNLELERKNPINIVRYPEEEMVHGNQFMSLGADGQVLVWDLKFESHRDRKNETIPMEGTINYVYVNLCFDACLVHFLLEICILLSHF